MRKPNKQQILIIKERFVQRYHDSSSELQFKNLYELLIAVMLSAQCTDKRVNIITPALFEKYPNISALSHAKLDEIKELIKSCSFFNNKAKNLIKMAKSVMENYDGSIPLEEKELVKLAGVGQKTAHVVMIEHTGANVMAVDTHVFRVAHRLGLSRAKTPIKTEEDLVKCFVDDLHTLHQGMVLFGRYICKAQRPKCDECFVDEFCQTKENFKTG